MELEKGKEEVESREADLVCRLDQLTEAHSQLVELLQAKSKEHEVGIENRTWVQVLVPPSPPLDSAPH